MNTTESDLRAAAQKVLDEWYLGDINLSTITELRHALGEFKLPSEMMDDMAEWANQHYAETHGRGMGDE